MGESCIKWGGKRRVWFLWLITKHLRAVVCRYIFTKCLLMEGSLGWGIISCTSPLLLERFIMCPKHNL